MVTVDQMMIVVIFFSATSSQVEGAYACKDLPHGQGSTWCDANSVKSNCNPTEWPPFAVEQCPGTCSAKFPEFAKELFKCDDKRYCDNLPAVDICEETETFCEASFRTDGSTCNDFCADHGLVCVEGWDEDGTDLSCSLKLTADDRRVGNGCGMQYGTQICKCGSGSFSGQSLDHDGVDVTPYPGSSDGEASCVLECSRSLVHDPSSKMYIGACSNFDFAPGSNSFDFYGNFCQPACRRALFTYFTDFGACQAKCPDAYDYPGPDQIQSRLAAMQQSSAVQMSVFTGCGGTIGGINGERNSDGYAGEFSAATAKVWAFTRGASHFTTLDGASYTFNGKGDFWLVKDRHENETGVQVQVRMNDECAGSKATCITGVAIATGVAGVNRKVVVVTDSGSGLQATVNGVVSFGGGALGSAADVLTLGFNFAQVESINGVKIDVTLVEGVIGVGVGVVDDHAGRVAGLYGNFDGDPTNDYAAPGAGPTTLNPNPRCNNGAGGTYVCLRSMTNTAHAQAACESYYGAGSCIASVCGSFSYWYSSLDRSCDNDKADGSYEFIYANAGYTTCGEDYGSCSNDASVAGNSLFVRQKISRTMWSLTLSNLGDDFGADGTGVTVDTMQASAESYCGSLGSTWSIDYTDAGGGSLYCLKDGTTSESNCDSCDTYRIVVWKDGGGETKHDLESYPFNTIAGNVYSAHTTPCSYTPDSLGSPCDTFAAGSAHTPAAPSTQDEMSVGWPSVDTTFLVSHGGWHFYKASTDCTSSACVSKTCADAGMETPCAGASGCEYNNNEVGCTLTSELGCNEPMDTTANVLCGSGTAGCSLLEAVYASMGTWSNGAACGLRGGSFCDQGSSGIDGYAFCATQRAMFDPANVDCEETLSPCTAACELAAARDYAVQVPAVAAGRACTGATDCKFGEDKCPAELGDGTDTGKGAGGDTGEDTGEDIGETTAAGEKGGCDRGSASQNATTYAPTSTDKELFAFGESWRVACGDSLFSGDPPDHGGFLPVFASDITTSDEVTQKCQAAGLDGDDLRNCEFDVQVSGDHKFVTVEQKFASFVSAKKYDISDTVSFQIAYVTTRRPDTDGPLLESGAARSMLSTGLCVTITVFILGVA